MKGDSWRDAIAQSVSSLPPGMADVPQDVDALRFVFTLAGARGNEDPPLIEVPAQEGCESAQTDRPVDKTVGCNDETR